MKFKLGSMFLVVLIALVALVGCDIGRDMVMDMMPSTDTEMADASDMAAVPVKLVWLINYPFGGKEAYIAWVASVAPTLQEPEEVKRIASYDNYYGASPHRLVEFEFDTIEDSNSYQEREESQAINAELPNRAGSVTLLTFVLRSDYVNE